MSYFNYESTTGTQMILIAKLCCVCYAVVYCHIYLKLTYTNSNMTLPEYIHSGACYNLAGGYKLTS